MRKNTIILIISIIVLIIFLYLQNNMIEITNLKLKLENLPKGFHGYRIVHLSDLQGKTFSKNNIPLISKIKNAKPDLIVISGDLISARYFDEDQIINLMTKLNQIAPVYYVTGNHELLSKDFPILSKKLIDKNINLLRNSNVSIKRNGDVINLTGIDDPMDTELYRNTSNKKILTKELEKALSKDSIPRFTILLSHRPEQFTLYANYNIDLIFSGHFHGGQIRLPIVGGILSPNQGFFPKYTSGKYFEKNSTMIVSRGLGNGSFPIRLFNRPEIVIVDLYKK
jgi:predicted MPP superfamily phosphohydrolase